MENNDDSTMVINSTDVAMITETSDKAVITAENKVTLASNSDESSMPSEHSGCAQITGSDKETVITDISTWSELAKYITAYCPTAEGLEGRKIQIELTCQICMTSKLILPDWITSDYCKKVRHGLHPSPYTYNIEEPLDVLPCGHFIGGECMATWFKGLTDRDKIPTCPLCRFPLIHSGCGHCVRIRRCFEGYFETFQDYVAYVPNTKVHRLASVSELKGTSCANQFVDVTKQWVKYTPYSATRNHGVGPLCFDCRLDGTVILAKKLGFKGNDAWEFVKLATDTTYDLSAGRDRFTEIPRTEIGNQGCCTIG
ncbi:hypothetical protein F5Y18DRAFT_436886 [Xylariaceae sp. FL1019]|nr:hypothetical protein F5Y18DRAFT_436886 [Xylariaceae sp. FL1019]